MSGTSGLLVSFASAGAVLLLIAVAGASVTVPLWRGRPHLAAAYGLLALGSAGIGCFFAFLLSPGLGVLVARATVLVAAGLAGWWAWRERAALPALRALLAPALLLAGTALASVGLFALWRVDVNWFDLARTRFFGPLPTDNQLPAMLASALWTHGDVRHSVGGDWHSSDRPPLQSGLLLLVQANTHRLAAPPGTVLFATGVVAQLGWLPATYALLRSLRLPRQAAFVALLFAAASGTVLVNTVFTWPKLLSAAFVLAAVAVLIELPPERSSPARVTAASVLAVLGALSHGAALFALPVIGYAVLRRRRALAPGSAALAVGAGVLVYLPWVAYQKWYDPPGDRLLKWHLAGVVPVTDTPFGTLLVRAYTSVPLSTLVHNKVSNVTELFARAPWSGIVAAFTGEPSARRAAEFLVVSATLGLAVVPLAVLVIARVRAAARHGVGRTSGDGSVPLLLSAAAAIGVWCLLMYGPATTMIHQGSHVPLLLLLVLPVAWCAARRPLLTAMLLPVQFALLGVTYGPRGAGEGPVSPLGAGLLAVGLLAAVGSVVLAGRQRPAERMPRVDPGPARTRDDDTAPLPVGLPRVASVGGGMREVRRAG